MEDQILASAEEAATEAAYLFPASFPQRRLWFLQQLEPGQTSYLVPMAWRLSGSLSLEAVTFALNRIVERHEVMRTSFEVDQGEPVQVVSPHRSFVVPLEDLSAEPDPEAAARELAAREANMPIELTGRLFRLKLLRLSPTEHLLCFTIHHIVFDGWSKALWLREFSAFYRECVAGTVAAVPELMIQYGDFAVWQQEQLQGDAFRTLLGFWKSALDGAPTMLALPLDRPRPAVLAHAGAVVPFTVPAALTAALRHRCRQSDATLFMILLAALNGLLMRFSGQRDILIGTPIANRERLELESLIGFFSNTLLMRAQMAPGDSFADLLARMKSFALDAYAHQDMPFEKLVEHLQPERNLSYNPLFQVIFALHNNPREPPQLPGVTVGGSAPARRSTKFDLNVSIVDHPDELHGIFEYKQDLFDPRTAEMLAAGYLDVLAAIVAEPAIALDALPLPAGLAALRELRRREQKPSLVVAASFTAEPIEETLSFWLKELEIDLKIEFAAYHQIFQHLLDPDSSLRRNDHGFNLLLVRFEDYMQGYEAGDVKAAGNLRRSVEELITAVGAAASEDGATYIIACCAPSPARMSDPAVNALLVEMEAQVAKQLAGRSGVQVITSGQTGDLYPVAQYADPYADEIGHVPYTKAYFTALGTMAVRRISALRGPHYKVIALDCDNTLWSGICGEDGALGVTVDSHRRRLQQFLRQQLEQGMLLCLCSKNNERDAWEVFESNPGMLLRQDDIVAWRINWQRKSQNLAELAAELGLGLDSFILLDDSAAECAEVEDSLPEVLTLQLPERGEQILPLLKHVWAFDHFGSTEVDRERTALYRDHALREQTRKGQSLDEFLESLELKIAFAPLTEEAVARVAQLTQRTNQFNFSTIRRDEAEIRSMLHSGELHCSTVTLGDRFGDYGLVGIVIYSYDGSSFMIDTFLLSCRALGRKVEHAVLAWLGEQARGQGIRYLDLRFVPSAKNAPAREFLDSLEFATLVSKPDRVTYRLESGRV